MKRTKKQVEAIDLLNAGHLMDEESNDRGVIHYHIDNKKYLSRTITPLIEQGIVVRAYYSYTSQYFTTATKERESFEELSHYFVGGIVEPEKDLRYTYQEIQEQCVGVDKYVTGYSVFEHVNNYYIHSSNKPPELRTYHTSTYSYYEEGSEHKSRGWKPLFKTRIAALIYWRYEQAVICAKKLKALDKAIGLL